MNNQTEQISNLQDLIIANYPRPIRVKGLLKKRKETPEEFLIKFFTEWNSEKDTIYNDNGIPQTAAGKRRSLGDIYMICKYYYKNITLNEVLNLLYNVLFNGIKHGFRTSYCTTINKRVWYYDKYSESRVYNEERQDEWGNDYQFYLNNIVK